MKVVLTIDTEPSIAGAFRNSNFSPLIHEPVAGIVNEQSEALGFLIRLFKHYQFQATFFVETVHTHYFSDAPMGHYVDQLLDASQDIQLHIHPVWHYFKTQQHTSDHCADHTPEFLADLIRDGQNILNKWTGKEPLAMRTGGFSVGHNVYQAMDMTGLNIASNICASYCKPTEKDLYVTHGKHQLNNIIELPVTCFHDYNIRNLHNLRSLQITAISGWEMTQTLDKMEKNGHEVAVIVTHPFEFLKANNYRYDNMRVNKMVQKRAEYLCKYLDKNRDRFDVVPIEQASLIPNLARAKIVTGNPFLSFMRSASNFINDKI